VTRIFCTIFNSVYLVRGLALIESLDRHCPDHRIYVFAMDEESAKLLELLQRVKVQVVRPRDFETPELLRVKPSRSIAEYFWTCTPHILQHCIDVLHEPECTYVDADVWLVSDPAPLFDEMGSASVLLTEHRYTPGHDQSALSGRFCVQFMRFVADERGRVVLQWWCDRCIEWCFARREDGKFGDQKYLDDWETRFPGIHVLRHVGGGIAPWNVGRTEFRRVGTEVQVRDTAGTPSSTGSAWRPLVFYHFHGLMSFSESRLCFAFGYRLPIVAKRLVYVPYGLVIEGIFRQICPELSGLAATGVAPGASSHGGSHLKRWARRLWGLPNTVTLSSLSREA
jgi:hypothetical protein